MERIIAHLDMDAFFASVEVAENPDLEGKPVVVGGGPGDRGVVTAASYTVRPFGVKSGMALTVARRLCPDLIVLPPRHHLYRQISAQVAEILGKWSPKVIQASIDEFYLDLSGTDQLFGHPEKIAAALKKEIYDQVGLPCTVGIGSSPLIAKVATNMAKPNGMLVVPAGEEAAFLAPLPLSSIPGIGPVLARKLKEMGLETAGQAAALAPETLEKNLGKAGARLARIVRGVDLSSLTNRRLTGNISHQETFPTDLTDLSLLRSVFLELVQRSAFRLRKTGMTAGRISLQVRYEDFSHSSISRAISPPTSRDDLIIKSAAELWEKFPWGKKAVRRLGAGLENLHPAGEQEVLFEAAKGRKRSSLDSAADTIRSRYGSKSIRVASSLPSPKKKENKNTN